MTTPLRFVFLPGIGNSEPEHWQARWYRSMNHALWVEQRDWDHPERDAWVGAARLALLGNAGPKLLVAHSLGCIVAAEVLAECGPAALNVVGALLVAVPDEAAPAFPSAARGFKRALDLTMPVRSVLVTSTNDPYGSYEHSARVAAHWGSRIVSVGARGHINLASNLGDWPEGRALLDELVAARPA